MDWTAPALEQHSRPANSLCCGLNVGLTWKTLTGVASPLIATARQKALCKKRQASVKRTDANQGIARVGHNPA